MAGLMIKDEASPRGPRGREAFCFFSIFSPKIQVLSAGLQVGSEISKIFHFRIITYTIYENLQIVYKE